MVKDHSDSEKGKPLPPHRLLFPINSKGFFYMHIPHTTAFVTPVVEHWLEREIAQWVHPMKFRFGVLNECEHILKYYSFYFFPWVEY